MFNLDHVHEIDYMSFGVDKYGTTALRACRATEITFAQRTSKQM